MAIFWERIRELGGQTLTTTVQDKKFRVTDVRSDRICFLPLEGKGGERWWPKRGLEELNELLYEEPLVTREMVRKHYPKDQNTAYVAAILNAVKEEEYSGKVPTAEPAPTEAPVVVEEPVLVAAESA